MTIYFAWVGGDPIPAFTINTYGDLWGGSVDILGQLWSGRLETTADFMAGAEWNAKVTAVTNMTDVSGLVVGRIYSATINTFETFFTYDGNYSGTLSDGVEPNEKGSMLLESTTGVDEVVLSDISSLVIGRTYNISGSGILDGTTFVFGGSATIILSTDVIENGQDVVVTVSSTIDQNVIKNIANTTGLVVGEIYQVFGLGLDASVLGTFQLDGTLLLSTPATRTIQQTFIRIHHGIIYPDGGDFDPNVHTREDELVSSVRIQQSEGNFAMLTIDLKNPRVAYLAPGRNVWCWLSWREVDGASPDTAIPLFHGRLISSPENIQNEKITLVFQAKPAEYENLQAILAATLQVSPYYDPVFFDNGAATADTILEARPASWHIDRVSLDVSISDITFGEDGTLSITEGQHAYADMNMRIGAAPLSAAYMSATVTWTQKATGSVDITSAIVKGFKEAGSPYGVPNIGAYQGSGLFDSWPKPLQSIGAGWSVNLFSTIEEVSTRQVTKDITTKYTTEFSAGQDFDDTSVDDFGNPTGAASKDAQGSYVETHAIFRMNVYKIYFVADYNASRDWTETVSFFMEADVQQLATDSRASTEVFSLNSNIIDKPIDFDGTTPLRDLSDNTFFKSSRGQEAFKFLLQYAKTKLIFRARAVEIVFTTTWQIGIGITLRKNVHIVDHRIPGGEAVGKVIEYEIIADGSEGMKVKITIGCTIGNGGNLTTIDGTESYVDEGYVDDGYQVEYGGTVDIGDGSIVYETFDDFVVVDDGVNFKDMTVDTVIKRCEVAGGVTAQEVAIAASKILPVGTAIGSIGVVKKQPVDPSSALVNCYPSILLELVPVTGGEFLSEFAVDVSKLMIVKTIDLAA